MTSQTDRDENREEQEDDEILVACRCESAKAVATLLQCLRHVASSGGVGDDAGVSSSSATVAASGALYSQSNKRFAGIKSSTGMSAMQPVTVFCGPSSLTFHAHGRAKQMQASVDLQRSLFSHYEVANAAAPPPTNHDEGRTTTDSHPPDDGGAWQGGAGGEFCVNLAKVLECLHVLGGAASNTLERTKLSFTYNATTEIFCMELLEQDTGMLVSAAIPGMVPPYDDLGNSLALAFRSSPLAARIIVQSDLLRDMVQELELVSGATQATVSLGPAGLEMAAVGHLGECSVSVPPAGPHVVSLEVHVPPHDDDDGDKTAAVTPRSYPLHALLASMRGLEIAQETCVTVNTAGMMAIQHQVVERDVGDGNPSFVDFILCCMEDEVEDGSEGATETEDASRSPKARRNRAAASYASPGSLATDGTRTAAPAPTRRGGRRESDDDGPTSSSDEENGDGRSMQSSLPLFGSVVNSTNASLTASSPEAESIRPGRRGGADAPAAAPTVTEALSPDTRWNGPKRRRRDRSFASSGRLGGSKSGMPVRVTTRSTAKADRLRGNKDDDSSSQSTNHLDDDGHDSDDDDEEEGGDHGDDDEVAGSQPLDVTDYARSPDPRRRDDRRRAEEDRDRDGDCSSPELLYGRQE